MSTAAGRERPGAARAYRGPFISGMPENLLVEVKSFPSSRPVPVMARFAWVRHWQRG